MIYYAPLYQDPPGLPDETGYWQLIADYSFSNQADDQNNLRVFYIRKPSAASLDILGIKGFYSINLSEEEQQQGLPRSEDFLLLSKPFSEDRILSWQKVAGNQDVINNPFYLQAKYRADASSVVGKQENKKK